MLTLPIKKKWFDMILSGEKKEEYREIKPYYMSRFRNMMSVHPLVSDNAVIERLKKGQEKFLYRIQFRNGYSKNSPSFITKCTLSIGTGKEEWGAENGKEYFVLTAQEILKGSEDFETKTDKYA